MIQLLLSINSWADNPVAVEFFVDAGEGWLILSRPSGQFHAYSMRFPNSSENQIGDFTNMDNCQELYFTLLSSPLSIDSQVANFLKLQNVL